MRIVGGKYKGRIFSPNKKFKARPTTDIAKEGLFNILENRYYFEGKKVLDLFAGTGSIGYEFVSRGCKDVTFVEANFNHYKYIQEILSALKIENARPFIFADPPFDIQRYEEIPEAILNADILEDGGLLIVEHPKEIDFSLHKDFKEIRKYGKVNFSFFEK